MRIKAALAGRGIATQRNATLRLDLTAPPALEGSSVLQTLINEVGNLLAPRSLAGRGMAGYDLLLATRKLSHSKRRCRDGVPFDRTNLLDSAQDDSPEITTEHPAADTADAMAAIAGNCTAI